MLIVPVFTNGWIVRILQVPEKSIDVVLYSNSWNIMKCILFVML